MESTTVLQDRLGIIIEQQDWNTFTTIVKPKMFHVDIHGNKIPRSCIGKIAALLTQPEDNLPDSVKILILKCLTNSCLPTTGYEHRSINTIELPDDIQKHNFHKLYNFLSDESHKNDKNSPLYGMSEYSETCFPYDGIIQWIIDYLFHHYQRPDPENIELDMMRQCFAFLSNVVLVEKNHQPQDIFQSKLKNIILEFFNLIKDTPKGLTLLHAICCFIGNVINKHCDYFTPAELVAITRGLFTANKMNVSISNDTLILLTKIPQYFHHTYSALSMEEKLYIIEMIYFNIHEAKVDNCLLTDDAVEFLAEQFKLKSDEILKTADTLSNEMEPIEIIILLDILNVLTANDNDELLKKDKSLLINVIYLLKALHMTGKMEDNYFRPIQKLSELAPSNLNQKSSNNSDKKNIQDHPAFGFKAALIRLIGNLVYKNQDNQNTVREEGGIPVLLDCCNIDARNPFIMQWAIVTIRHLCDGNLENQNIIQACEKVGDLKNT